MQIDHYDIAIIGAGAAGLQLAMGLGNDRFFQNKHILILEKDAKNINDRTWSFWEKGQGKWDELILQKWQKGIFYSPERKIELELLPYQYKTLRSIDFYKKAKSDLAKKTNVTWLTDEIKDVIGNNPLQIVGENKNYYSELVFDSRIPKAFLQNNDSYTRLLQHFKGWVIRTKEDRFNPEEFTMMDYRLRWQDTTSFMYILPFAKNEALVEFTFFSPQLVDDAVYDLMLKKYIGELLNIDDYEITEKEHGIIPMSDFPFEKYTSEKHILIGTAGGWVKPSSGYSFKNCERNVQLIIANLKNNHPVNTGIFKSRFQLYDSIFLHVLDQKNELGPDIFNAMYFRNNIQKIFAFLDEETLFGEELKIMFKLQKWVFTKSFFEILFRS